MTEYLILKRGENPPEEVASLCWMFVGAQTARSSKAAITAYIGEDAIAGDFVAVPARSWRPVSVKVETKTALKFS